MTDYSHHIRLTSADHNFQSRLPFSQACENNKQPIAEILSQELAQVNKVLEIGSGTGQHAVFFAAKLAHLQWQTSDVTDNLGTINAWISQYPYCNVMRPIKLDLRVDEDLTRAYSAYEAVFTANTLHIISWPLVERLFSLVSTLLPFGGKFCVYGPFNYKGEYTSESNRNFDAMLRQRDSESGIRDIEAIMAVASSVQLSLKSDYTMPANNRLLIFKK